MMQSRELLYTHRSSENADYVYYANIIRDNFRVVNGKPCYEWFGDADNDVDGAPYWHSDPYGQRDTRWKYDGRSMDGDVIPFMVVPPQIVNITPEIVGGCIGTVEYKGVTVSCVVGDSGPLSKIGELSPAALRDLDLPALRNGDGGLDTQEILYRIWPGVSAVLHVGEIDFQFVLQHA